MLHFTVWCSNSIAFAIDLEGTAVAICPFTTERLHCLSLFLVTKHNIHSPCDAHFGAKQANSKRFCLYLQKRLLVPRCMQTHRYFDCFFQMLPWLVFSSAIGIKTRSLLTYKYAPLVSCNCLFKYPDFLWSAGVHSNTPAYSKFLL